MIDDTTPKFLESITEHPDVQRLIGQVVELQAENKKLQGNLVVWRAACGINEKRIEQLQAENKRLIEAIDVSLYAIKNLGAGGHAETPLLVLKPERGDNAVILATYMPHSGADTTLQYLQRECVRPMEQALKEALIAADKTFDAYYEGREGQECASAVKVKQALKLARLQAENSTIWP